MLTLVRPTVLRMHMSMLYMHICFQYDTEQKASGMSDYADSCTVIKLALARCVHNECADHTPCRM